MTDWVDIANSAIAPKAPVTSELMTALRDNTVVTMWETVTTIYDAAIDGTVSSVETPDFEDGWDYALFFNGVYTTSTTGSFRIECAGPSQAYTPFSFWSTAVTASANPLTVGPTTIFAWYGRIYFPDTRWDRPSPETMATFFTDTGVNYMDGSDDKPAVNGAGVVDFLGKIDKIRIIAPTTATINQGQIFLQRRRNEAYA